MKLTPAQQNQKHNKKILSTRYRYMEQNNMKTTITFKDLERFNSYIEKQPNGCEIWTGCLAVTGAGMFMVRGKTHTTNRFVAENIMNVTLTNTDRVVSTCCNKLCCNPAHLQIVDRSSSIKKTYLPNPFYEFISDLDLETIKANYKHYCREWGRAAIARRYNISPSKADRIVNEYCQ
jgi:hypothetical protein